MGSPWTSFLPRTSQTRSTRAESPSRATEVSDEDSLSWSLAARSAGHRHRGFRRRGCALYVSPWPDTLDPSLHRTPDPPLWLTGQVYEGDRSRTGRSGAARQWVRIIPPFGRPHRFDGPRIYRLGGVVVQEIGGPGPGRAVVMTGSSPRREGRPAATPASRRPTGEPFGRARPAVSRHRVPGRSSPRGSRQRFRCRQAAR